MSDVPTDLRPSRSWAIFRHAGRSPVAAMAVLGLVTLVNAIAPVALTSAKRAGCSDPLCQCAHCASASDEPIRSCCASKRARHDLPELWHCCHHGDNEATPSTGSSEAELPARPQSVAAARSSSNVVDALTLPIARPPQVPEPIPRTVA
jgi:hypothetical protein